MTKDASLWAKVTADVTPLANRPAAPPLPRLRRLEPRLSFEDRVLAARLEHKAHGPVPSETGKGLDHRWEDKIRKGQIAPDLTIDLHGYRAERAFEVLRSGLHRAASRHGRVALVITGKGKTTGDWSHREGVLRAELPKWLDSPSLRPLVAALRQAHPRHGGAGAWYVILKRAKP
jgi:DNA-nicking Smr family endonuclease